MPPAIEEFVTSRLDELRQQLLTEYNTELRREVDEHTRQLMLQVVSLRAENDQLREQLALPARPPSLVPSRSPSAASQVHVAVDRKASKESASDKALLQRLEGAVGKLTAPPPVEPRPLAVVPEPMTEPPGLISHHGTETSLDQEYHSLDEEHEVEDFGRIHVCRGASVRSVEGRLMEARRSGKNNHIQDRFKRGNSASLFQSDGIHDSKDRFKRGNSAGFFDSDSAGLCDGAMVRKESSRQRKKNRAHLFNSQDGAREKLDSFGESVRTQATGGSTTAGSGARGKVHNRYQSAAAGTFFSASAAVSRQASSNGPLDQGAAQSPGAAEGVGSRSLSRFHHHATVPLRKKPANANTSSEETSASEQPEKLSATKSSDEERHSNASWCSSASNAISEDECIFFVWPIWTEKEKLLWASSCKSSRIFNNCLTRGSADPTAGLEDDSDSDDQEDMEVVKQKTASKKGCSNTLTRCLQRVTLHPSSAARIMWDMVGCVMIGYDFVMVPLQFFDPPTTLFLMVMSWLVRVYWTLDFPLSFLTGYTRPEGRVEMRNLQIMQRYCCTWMFFDVTILSFDWLEVIVGETGGLGAARIGKMLKSMRLLRMVRLVRLIRVARMPDFLHSIAFHFQSERLSIMAGILRIVIFLVGVLHFIACCWYGIGIDVADDAESWVRDMDLDKSVLEYQYVTSFHWSLTQFTGTVDINPHNIGERIFAVVVLLFGFLISASVVSSITSSMTRLQIVSARQATQTSLLNQYLFDNGISTKVALRVQRNAMYALSQEKKNTPESAIELLTLVSEPLRVELHYEIHLPVLAWHPFFRRFNEVNANATRRICHSAVSRLSICRGDILFSTGEEPQFPTMYFIMHGRMQYAADGLSPQPLQPENKWASEPVLWTPWVHLGILRARSECQLTLLDASQFQKICVQFRTQEFYPRLYAEEFVSELNKSGKDEINDMNPGFDVEKVAAKIFPVPGTDYQDILHHALSG